MKTVYKDTNGITVTVMQVPGAGHTEEDMEDVCYTKNWQGLLFAGLADGQGGKRYCRLGGMECLRKTADFYKRKGVPEKENADTFEMRYQVFSRLRRRLKKLEEQQEAARDEFASTLAGFACDPYNGNFILTLLGNEVIFGVTEGENDIRRLSPKRDLLFPADTWMTTSENAALHLRFVFGNIRNFRRIVLFTDGAEALLCHRGYLFPEAEKLLKQGTPEELRTYMSRFKPVDDASCILLDLYHPNSQ